MFFFDLQIIRTPNFPIEPYKPLNCEDPFFRESIYIASPILHSSLLNNSSVSDKLLNSLMKYDLRIKNRATPFGMFASVGVVEWGNNKSGKLQLNSKYFKRTLDEEILSKLEAHILTDKKILCNLSFKSNTSIYVRNEFINYLEVNSKNEFELNSSEADEFIINLIDFSKTIRSHEELVKWVVKNADVSIDEAKEYIEELYNNQVLIPNTSIEVSGYNKLLKLKNTIDISAIPQNTKNLITDIVQKLDESTDSYQFSNIGKGITDSLSALLDIPKDKSFFKVDSFVTLDEENKFVSADLKELLMDSISPLIKLKFSRNGQSNERLNEFIKSFYSRFNTREVALSTVLDPETGIIYSENDSGHTNTLSNQYQTLFKESERDNKPIELSELTNNINVDPNACLKDIPATIYMVYKNHGGIADDDLPLLEISSLGGSSGVNLVSRFAYGNEQIKNICEKVVEFENDNLADNTIYAEILHVPNAKVGNILGRQDLREYQIPLLSFTSDDNTIQINDLMVSVDIVMNRIYLKSKKSGKYIIPRLSTAHNYRQKQLLPAYRFLSDMQFANGVISNLTFNWDPELYSLRRLPRVVHKNIIISRERWCFPPTEYPSEKTLNEFIKNNSIPDKVLLCINDHYLPIDFNDKSSCKLFFKELKKTPFLELKEVIDSKDFIVQDESSQGYNNEFIGFIANDKFDSSRHSPEIQNDQKPVLRKRKFFLGSKWVYFKIYGNPNVLDKLLKNEINELRTTLQNKKIINSWFFIRYNDATGPHLRVRFHLSNVKLFSFAISEIQSSFALLVKNDIINTMSFDIYEREIERYGINCIEVFESIFNKDSENILEIINRNQINRNHFLIQYANYLLDLFELSLNEKFELLKQISSFDQFSKENPKLKVYHDQKYREFKNLRTEDILPFNNHDSTSLLAKRIMSRSNKNTLHMYLPSLIHMSVNRTLERYSRDIEIEIINVLFREIRSKVARAKKAA